MTTKKPLLSLEEMQALAAAGAGVQTPPSSFGFYLRTGVSIAIVAANVLSLTFFSERVFGKFDLPPETLEILLTYVQARIVIALVAVPLYLISFYKKFYFIPLSFGLVLLMSVNLINDWMLIFAHVRPEAMTSVAVMIGLRLMVMGCVILNARFYLQRQ